jgi:hypothetical protein
VFASKNLPSQVSSGGKERQNGLQEQGKQYRSKKEDITFVVQ